MTDEDFYFTFNENDVEMASNTHWASGEILFHQCKT